MEKQKKRVIVSTIISGLLFLAVIIGTSLPPLSETLFKSNPFGSAGMWRAVGLLVLFYGIPLTLYVRGMSVMKRVMAVLCGIGIFIHVALIAVLLSAGSLYDFLIDSGVVELETTNVMSWPTFVIMGLAVAAVIANIVWFRYANLRGERSNAS